MKGAPYEIACNYARIDYTTFLNWRKKAEEDKLPDYIEFFKDLKEAEGSISLKWLNHIDDAMEDGTWSAAAWKLERRRSKYFSQQAAIIELNERLDKLEKGNSNESSNGSQEGQERSGSEGENKNG